MTTISSVGSSAWSSAAAMQRTQPQRRGPSPEELLSKLDSDGSGGVSGTELQGLLEKVAKKGGADGTAQSATDLVTQYDSDGDGNLNAQELGKTLESLMPQRSTMDFAQARGTGSAGGATGQAGDDLFGKVDEDGDGSVSQTELQSLLEKMSGGAASATGTSSDELFGQLDSDGDGKLSQAEFDAGRPSDGAQGEAAGGASGMRMAGGMPPPPPGGPGGPGGAGGAQGANASASSSSSTSYDPLDTNEDGTVSAAERAAGAIAAASSGTGGSSETDAVTALFNAIDSDGDKKVSDSEAQSFIAQLTSPYAAATSASGTSAASSSSSASSSTTEGETGRQGSGRLDLAQLAGFARRQYESTASAWADGSSRRSGAVSALA
ncbi:EF-hand domain-containing protein [Acidovorax sp. GBBC 3334]|uniref:EF-hand domain-containing protein n=1 Tax=Acidovorax sp. GBBC 3334 TaxID=2940496 RepID=UPI002304924F|nr:EF-hand domain-containing protein [Acidovorax sp. GBBC 3334]MDA8454812.1 EF-hand domain-containing protein [Acidovorax sp. GBBC 3334]